MEIKVNHLTKRFNQNLLFNDLSFQVQTNQHLAILGSNGSGKSSLIKCLMGFSLPTGGNVQYFINQKEIEINQISNYISVATPYLGLTEELTFEEIINFQKKFKPTIENFSAKNIVELTDLQKHKNKPIKSYSSGMKQRVKLALALFFDTPFLFLDEPTSNLDEIGVDWFKNNITVYKNNRIVVVCSNHQHKEIFYCTHSINLLDSTPTLKEGI